MASDPDPDSDIEIVQPTRPSLTRLSSLQPFPPRPGPSQPTTAHPRDVPVILLSSDSEKQALDKHHDDDGDDLPDALDLFRNVRAPPRTVSAPSPSSSRLPLLPKTSRTQSDSLANRLNKGKGKEIVLSESPASSYGERYDDLNKSSPRRSPSSSQLELDSILGPSRPGTRLQTPSSPEPPQMKKRQSEVVFEREDATAPTAKKKKKASTNGLSQAQNDAKKAMSQRDKAAEKQARKEQIRIDREAKKAAKDREAAAAKQLRDANKLTLDRKETVVEVTMHLPSRVMSTKNHPLTKAIEALRDRMTVEDVKMNNPVETDAEEEVVRWLREVPKEWIEDEGCYRPCPLKKIFEQTVLVVWTAKQVDDWVAAGPRELLDRAHALRVSWPLEQQIFIVIHGLDGLMRTVNNRSNAIIANTVRADLAAVRGEPEAYGRQQLKTNGLPKSSQDGILREIERMKMATKCFVIRVENKIELANWLWEMTLEIGVRPYKRRDKNMKAELNLEVGGAKGKDAEDTYIKMLSSLVRVTENEAKGIVEKFPTLNKLYSAWDRLVMAGDQTGAEQMLKGKNLNGVACARAIGKINSKRIFEIMYQTMDGDCTQNT